jgi:ribonuclease III
MATPDTKVALCETIIAHEFNDKMHCLQALQASGHLLKWQGRFVAIARNDRLAVFGDAIIKAHLCRRWLESGRNKGF